MFRGGRRASPGLRRAFNGRRRANPERRRAFNGRRRANPEPEFVRLTTKTHSPDSVFFLSNLQPHRHAHLQQQINRSPAVYRLKHDPNKPKSHAFCLLTSPFLLLNSVYSLPGSLPAAIEAVREPLPYNPRVVNYRTGKKHKHVTKMPVMFSPG